MVDSYCFLVADNRLLRLKEFKVSEREFYPLGEMDGTNLKVVFLNEPTQTSITARFNVLLCDVKKIDNLIDKAITLCQFAKLIKHAVKIEKVSTEI